MGSGLATMYSHVLQIQIRLRMRCSPLTLSFGGPRRLTMSFSPMLNMLGRQDSMCNFGLQLHLTAGASDPVLHGLAESRAVDPSHAGTVETRASRQGLDARQPPAHRP